MQDITEVTYTPSTTEVYLEKSSSGMLTVEYTHDMRSIVYKVYNRMTQKCTEFYSRAMAEALFNNLGGVKETKAGL